MSEILGTLFKYLVSLLGVAAVVLVLYQVFSANKTQTAISDITLLQSNTQALYNAQSTFGTASDDITGVAIAAKLAPSNMINSTTTLTNPWGGDVKLLVGATNTQFSIKETNVPADACAKIAVALGSLVTLKVGATGGTDVTLGDVGGAALACAAAPGPAYNTMVMTFSH